MIDFGLARLVGSSTRHTQAGQPPGTPAYMSPEQISEDELTSATDIFSWAGLTAFAATGHQPFAAPDAAMSALWRQISEAPPNLGALPGELRDVVAAAMSKDPARRPTAEQILLWPPFAAPPRRAGPRRRPAAWPPAAAEQSRPRLRPNAALVVSAAVATVIVAAVGVLIAQLFSPSVPGHPKPGAPTRTPSGPSASLSSASSSASASASASAGTPAPSRPAPGAAVSVTQGLILSATGSQPRSVAFSPDGSTITASMGSGGNQQIDEWNAATLKSLPGEPGPGGGAYAASIAYDPVSAGTLAVGGGTTLKVWDEARSKAVTYTDPDGQPIMDVAYSPDGKTIAEVNNRGDVHLVANGNWLTQSFRDTVTYDAAQPDQLNPDEPVQVALSNRALGQQEDANRLRRIN